MRPSAANADLDIGMSTRETRERGRRDVEGEVGRESEREQTSAPFASSLRLGDPTPHGLERSLRARQETATGRRQGHAAPSPNEQLRAKLAFEAPQTGSQRRLRELQGRRGARDAPPSLRFDEGLDLAQFHASSIDALYGTTCTTGLFYAWLPSVRCRNSRLANGRPL